MYRSQENTKHNTSSLKSLVLVLLVMCIWSCERTTEQIVVPIYSTSELEIDHPFTIEATHLLDVDSRSELIMQTRIDHYDIREALDEVFYAEQLVESTDTILRFTDFEVPVTQYDPQSRIGYLLLDHGRFGDGVSDVMQRNLLIEKQAQQKIEKKIADGIEMYFDDEEMFLIDTIRIWKAPQIPFDKVNELWTLHGSSEGDTTFNTRYDKMLEQHERENGSYMTQPSPFEMWADLDGQSDSQKQILTSYQDEIVRTLATLHTREDKREYLEIVLLDMCKMLQIDRLSAIQEPSIKDDWKMSAINNVEDPLMFFACLARIDAVSVSPYQSELYGVMRDAVAQLGTADTRKEWQRKSNALVDLLSVNTNQIVAKSAAYQDLLIDIITSVPTEKWQDQYAEIQILSEAEEVTLDDLKRIHNLPNTHGIYIAPVSIFDDRMVYDMGEDDYLADLAAARKAVAEATTSSDRKRLQVELLAMSNYRATNYAEIRKIAKDSSVSKLKSDMIEFISWARARREL